ncbi:MULTISPECIES: class I SAM-dependent methyltransferase [unclassified Streptomyces]|uniref:class I SAM-dependent methyltransferase n=1 Tax=unclassified Streptomyces TaxID=2593676 RepID=UPI00336AE04A
MPENNIRRSALDSLESQQRFDTVLAEIDDLDGFDTAYGVETSRPVEPWEIREADDTTLVNNSRYSPTPVRTIRLVISAAGVRYEDMSFVDFGCGKGRVLFVAADFPFRRVIGVEFSSELCEIARKNAASYSAKVSNERPIDVVCRDARDFEIPDDAGFFYFYEPFSAAVTERVLDNIEASLARAPRAVVLCLVGTALVPVLDGRGSWSRLGGTLASPDDAYFEARLYTNPRDLR